MNRALADLMRVSLNGNALSERRPELPFRPGQQHVLRICPKWSRLGLDVVNAIVRKTLPDGTVEELGQKLSRGDDFALVLGPLTAPPVYEYEAGVVCRRGYQLDICLRDPSVGRVLCRVALHQALAPKPVSWVQGSEINAGAERLVLGDAERIVYNPLYGVEAALALRLSPEVVQDQNVVQVQYRLNPGCCVRELRCELTVVRDDGKTLVKQRVKPGRSGKWASRKLDVRRWRTGSYRICLHPVVDSRVWHEGPCVTYRRAQADRDTVAISPLAPWTLVRDARREALTIDNFAEAAAKWASSAPQGWRFGRGSKSKPIYCPPGQTAEPLELRLPLKGYHAVYATPHADGCLVQIGKDPLIRSLAGAPAGQEVLVCAADMTGAAVRVLAFDPLNRPKSGLSALRFVPVTKKSVDAFHRETSRPPVPLYGVNDWCCYFHGPVRLEQDQFDTVVGGQAELGMRTLDWSVGRSWVEYHSILPDVTRFPCVPYEDAAAVCDQASQYLGRIAMINDYRPLESVYENRSARRHAGESRWASACPRPACSTALRKDSTSSNGYMKGWLINSISTRSRSEAGEAAMTFGRT